MAGSAATGGVEEWPALPYDAWKDTRDTVHMYTQVAGKLRLALAPFEPQWANVPLYVTARGLTTSPMPLGPRTLEVVFDFFDHGVELETSDGRVARIELEPRTVADFYAEFLRALDALDARVEFTARPSEVPDPIPFAEDTVHRSYDRDAVNRFFRVLSRVDTTLKEHRAGFRGRHTPVHFFWGTFDLAYARFCGRDIEPSGDNVILRKSTDEEQMAAGWWPGSEQFPEPAFFAFYFPPPDGLEREPVGPDAAFWSDDLGEFLLRYDDARAAPDTREAILEFLRRTYETSARFCHWEPRLLETVGAD
jgi:hypothetical protein